jgi:hypothetical protein
MPGLVPGIHEIESRPLKAWMAGTSVQPGHDDGGARFVPNAGRGGEWFAVRRAGGDKDVFILSQSGRRISQIQWDSLNMRRTKSFRRRIESCRISKPNWIP